VYGDETSFCADPIVNIQDFGMVCGKPDVIDRRAYTTALEFVDRNHKMLLVPGSCAWQLLMLMHGGVVQQGSGPNIVGDGNSVTVGPK
jgi:hypothetical protein